MSKDKTYGFCIFLFGLLMAVFYILWGPVNLIMQNSGKDWAIVNWVSWEWAAILPTTFMVVMIGLLAMWIGYSMITTPPPVPLEELEEELEAEEAASKNATENSDAEKLE